MALTARVLLATLQGGNKAPMPSSRLATCKAGSRRTLTISLAFETTFCRFSLDARALSTLVRAFDITTSAYSMLAVTFRLTSPGDGVSRGHRSKVEYTTACLTVQEPFQRGFVSLWLIIGRQAKSPPVKYILDGKGASSCAILGYFIHMYPYATLDAIQTSLHHEMIHRGSTWKRKLQYCTWDG